MGTMLHLGDPMGWMVTLLGESRIVRADGGLVRLPGKRERIVLAVLGLAPNQRVTRPKLASLLWGHKVDEAALDNLRTCLWSLRKGLGDAEHIAIASDGDAIALQRELFRFDVWDFQEHAAHAGGAELERAAEIYAGEFLDGLDIASEEFEDWVRHERARLRELATDALTRLAMIQASSGASERAIEAAQRALRLDPLHEQAARALMTAYTQSGRRRLAMQFYRGFAETLREELGAEPERETRRLFEEAVTGAEEPDTRAEIEPAPPAAAPRPGIAADSAAASSPGSAPAATKKHAGRASERLSQARRRRRWLRIAMWAAGSFAGIMLAATVSLAAIFWRIPELAPALFGRYLKVVKESIVAEPLSIAVLPFTGHGDQDARELADALSEGLTAALSLASDMMVVARSSVAAYEGQTARPQDVALALGVRYLVEGSVTKWGDTVTTRVGLIDTRKGELYVPVEQYERRLNDFVRLQKDITLKVITALEVRLTEGEQDSINLVHGTDNLDAWLLAARAQKQLRQFTKEGNAKARDFYEQALALDPQYPAAWDGLAWTHLIDARFAWSPSRTESMQQAIALVDKALVLDTQKARIYSLQGAIKLLTGAYGEAVSLGEQAVAFSVNDADAAALLAFSLTYTGEPGRAIALTERAIRLRPVAPHWYYWLLGRANRLAGHYQAAVAILESEEKVGSRSIVPLVELVAAYSQTDEPAKAKLAVARLLEVAPRFSAREWLAAPAYSDQVRANKEFEALVMAGVPE